MPLAPGSTFGNFRIIEPLGRGGMAAVHKAYEPALDREVALKVLPAEFMHDPGFAERFEREAKIVAKLEHRHIVPIYTFGIDENIPWMAMRLVPGGTLADLLKRGRLDHERGLWVLKESAEALDYAHTQGVLHRDVKPQNILLDSQGHVYLADFGIAKIVEGSSVITKSGVITGTPQYMSPEQWRGENVDRRTDIYALGVMAYELFAGRVPFSADTPAAMMTKHLMDPIPIPSRDEVPESLLRPLLKCLDKNPEVRWPSASSFVRALEDGLREAGGHAAPPPDGSRPTITVSRMAAPIQEKTGLAASLWRRRLGFGGLALCSALALTWLWRSSTQPGVPEPKVPFPGFVGPVAPSIPPPATDTPPVAALTPRQAGLVPASVRGMPPPPASGREKPLTARADARPAFLQGDTISELPGDVAGSERACKGGSQQACTDLGRLYSAGSTTVKKDPIRGFALLNSACEAGYLLGCTYLGMSYAEGTGVAKDEAQAVTLYEKGCDGGSPGGCNFLGLMHYYGKGVKQDKARAASLYRKACEGNFSAGCSQLGEQYFNGIGVSQDDVQAGELLRKACDLGDLRGCTFLGKMYEDGRGGPRNALAAAGVYKRACDGGDGMGCVALASLYRVGQGVQKDAERAVALFKKGCEAGNNFGCNYLAVMYGNGDGIPKNAAVAVRLFRQTCDAGDGYGCFNLGLAYRMGTGIAADTGEAFTLFKKACDLGFQSACTLLADAYARGDGTAKDPTEAMRLFSGACAGGNASACDGAGEMLESGAGGRRSLDKAASFYQKACDGGFSPGCTKLGLLAVSGQGVSKDQVRAEALFKKACEGGQIAACEQLRLLVK